MDKDERASGAAPQVIEENGIPAAMVVCRRPGSDEVASSAAETSAGRSADVATIGAGNASATTATVARYDGAMAKQFVVELKNEPGAMATLAEALAARGVDLRAIGGGSIGDSGHVIMTTADDETAKAVLDEQGYNYIEGEIDPGRGRRPAGRDGPPRSCAGRRERQHLRPPVPRSVGR